MTIARLTVQRGTLTEYPIAEQVKGGWQNGVSFYADETVTKVTPLDVKLPNTALPDGSATHYAWALWHLHQAEASGGVPEAQMHATLAQARALLSINDEQTQRSGPFTWSTFTEVIP